MGGQRNVNEKQAVEKMPDKKVRILKGRWADEEDRDGDAEDLAEWWVSGLSAHCSK